MKDVTIEQFSANIFNTLSDVLFNGDICRITTDKGNAVIMEEAEYNVLRDAMELLIKQNR